MGNQRPSKFELQKCVLKSNKRVVSINRKQFLQSLVDHMNLRLCTASPENVRVLECMKVLDTTLWHEEPGIRFGEEEILFLARRLNLDERQAIQGMRNVLRKRQLHHRTYCLCTHAHAECERDFSLMNTIVSDV